MNEDQEFSWIGATSTATDAPEIVSAALDLESEVWKQGNLLQFGYSSLLFGLVLQRTNFILDQSNSPPTDAPEFASAALDLESEGQRSLCWNQLHGCQDKQGLEQVEF